MSQNPDIERLIQLGEKEFFIKKNYEEAEKMFLRAKEIDPSCNKNYISYFLEQCHRHRIPEYISKENNPKHLEDKTKNSGSEIEDFSKRSSEKGGREALGNESPNYKHGDYFEEIGKKNREISELKSKDNRSVYKNLYETNNRTVTEKTCSVIKTQDTYRTKRCENYQSSDKHAQHEQKIVTVPTVYEKEKDADYSVKYDELKKKDNTCTPVHVSCIPIQAYKNEIKITNVETESEINQEEFPIDSKHEANTGSHLKMQDQNEIEILRNSLKMRSYVLCIGIKVFGSKPNYRPDVCFEKVAHDIEQYILQARYAFHCKNYDECELNISNAEKIYSNVAIILPQASISKHTQVNPSRDTANALNSTTSKDSNLKSVSYKEFVKGDDIDVIKCLKLAETALNVKDFKKAARLIKKSERICPTKNAQELMKRLEAAEKELAAELAMQKAQQEAELAAQKAQQDAELAAQQQETVLNTEEKKESEKELLARKEMYVGKDTQSIQSEIQNYDNYEEKNFKLTDSRPVADESMLKAKETIKNNDFTNAEKYLLKAKRLNQEIDIEPFLSQIRIAVASRSSTAGANEDELVFQPGNDKKRNSNMCRKIAEHYFKNRDVAKAEIYLLKAKEYYNSNQVRELLDVIQKLKSNQLSWKTLDSTQFPEPSFVNSNSENHFAYNPGEEETPFYRLTSEEIEEYLKRARFALTKCNIEEAEEFALKCKALSPVRAQGILKDIENIKELRKKSYTRTLRSGHKLTTNDDNENSGVGVAQKTEELITAAEMEYVRGNLDNAYELLEVDKEAIQTSPRGRLLLKKLLEEKSKAAICLKDQSVIITDLGKNQPSKTNDSEIHHGIDSDIRKDTTDAVESCITKAEEAFFVNNFDDAEHFLEKAYRICPDEKISEFLDKIHKHKETKAGVKIKETTQPEKTHLKKHSDCQNEQETRKCLDMAEKAYNEKDFDRAERLFSKAFRMKPCNYVNDCLMKVRDDKNKSMKKEKEELRVEYAVANAEISNIAESYTSFAVEAMESECYFVAEKYLEKANYHFTNDTTSELLKIVQEKIYERISNERKEHRKLNVKQTEVEKEKLKELQCEAEKYLKIAKGYFNRGDLANAQAKTLISDSFCSSCESRQLFKEIFSKKYDCEKKCMVGKQKKRKNNLGDFNYFKSEQYKEIAESAIKNGDYNLAEEYLVESNKIYNNPVASNMLKNIRAIKSNNSRDASPSNVHRWVQKGTNWFCETFF